MLFLRLECQTRTLRLAGAALAACLAALPLPAAAKDASWPAAVSANYKLYFAGFEVGRYDFASTAEGDRYQAKGSAAVSALFGAFTWKGGIESTGTLEPAAPRPAGYKLDFKSGKKRGSVAMGFAGGAVTSVTLVPEKPPKPDAVPVRTQHLQGVVDPMSSILAITHAGGTDPCRRRIAIFDGKVRFDLAFSPKGSERIAEPGGAPFELKVCRVKYLPVSGHRPKDFVKPWVDYDSIEIALRPVPAANIFVPYRVTISTTLGAAVMRANAVNITAANNARIALRQ